MHEALALVEQALDLGRRGDLGAELRLVPRRVGVADRVRARGLDRDALPELRVGLSAMRPRTKAALLAVCVGVLRYGLVRTAVALLAARLAADLAAAGLRGVRERLGGAPPNPPTPTTDVE